MIIYRTYKGLPEIEVMNVAYKRNGKVWFTVNYNEPVMSPFWCYHDTWQAAKHYLLSQAKVNLVTAKHDWIIARDRVTKIKELRKN